jgi:hypothetical protein
MVDNRAEIITRAVYCVLDREQKPRGTAFLVHGRILLTCAHVVACAQTNHSNGVINKEMTLTLKLPMVSGSFQAKVIHYVDRFINFQHDVAFLELMTDPYYPSDPRMAWHPDIQNSGMNVRAYGYHEGNEPGIWSGGSWSTQMVVGGGKWKIAIVGGHAS